MPQAGIRRSAVSGAPADTRSRDGSGQAGQATQWSQDDEAGARQVLAGAPVAAGRPSIAGSPPLPPSCLRLPSEAPSRHRASASRCASGAGSCPACSRWRWCRPMSVAAPAAARDGRPVWISSRPTRRPPQTPRGFPRHALGKIPDEPLGRARVIHLPGLAQGRTDADRRTASDSARQCCAPYAPDSAGSASPYRTLHMKRMPALLRAPAPKP